MKTNEALQRDVQNALKWEPSLEAAEIGVTVKDGVVTLLGTVDSYFKKSEAENAAKNVAGVRAVAEEIEVRHRDGFLKTDEEIATSALKALQANLMVPDEKLKVKVEDGWVLLEGELPWDYQRRAAVNAIRYLAGVKGVTNNVRVKSDIHDSLEKSEIEKALARNSSLGKKDISVRVTGSKVTLTGFVASVYQREEAGRVAWKTPGVLSVENNLEVEYDYAFME